jgi:hypothetical protein
MENALLLRSQQNEVFEVLRKQGFDVSQFRWRERKSTKVRDLRVHELAHLPSNSYFIFDWYNKGIVGAPRKQWAQFSPGAESVVERQYPGSWELQVKFVRLWLSYLRRELEAPDLWSEFAQQAGLIDVVSTTEGSNSPFSLEERHFIADRLNDISHQIAAEHRLSEYQTAQLESQVAYLVDSSERTGRRDWAFLALGVITNIMLMGTVPPDAGRQMFELLSQVFQQLLTQGQALLQ